MMMLTVVWAILATMAVYGNLAERRQVDRRTMRWSEVSR